MDTILEDLMPDIPVALESLSVMTEPNQSVIIYEGEFMLVSETLTIPCNGKIYYKWMPSKSILFNTQVLFSMELKKIHEEHKHINILVQGNIIGIAVLVGFSTSTTEQTFIKGQFETHLMLGDRTINVTSVRFEIPNLRSFLGDAIRWRNHISRGRLSFTCDRFILIIDQPPELKGNFQKLKEEGGYHLTATGSLIKMNGSISFDELLKFEKVLSYFLGFIGGIKISGAFFKGMFEEEIKWQYCAVPEVDQHQTVFSWAPEQQIDGYSALWQAFMEKLYGNHTNSWLTFAIHWYLEANKRTGGPEAVIMVIQCALELLYNHVIVEDKKILKGEDAANLSAANKIRLLLNNVNVNAAIPAEMSNAIVFCKAQKQNWDGPDLLVDIRNAIVHGQEQKRKKLLEVPGPVIVETLNLGTYYVERIICKLLNYKGYHFNRTTQVKVL